MQKAASQGNLDGRVQSQTQGQEDRGQEYEETVKKLQILSEETTVVHDVNSSSERAQPTAL